MRPNFTFGNLMVPVLLVASFLFAYEAAAQTENARSNETVVQDEALSKIVDQVVQKQIEQQKLVGVCVGVIRNGEIVCLKSFGSQDLENSIDASTETMFRWASISKPITAIAAMQLVEQGKLNLDDDVRKYVPEFPDKGHVIRVRDLLCHQSGIVHYFNGKVIQTQREYEEEHPFENVVFALDKFKESLLVHPPGEKFSYSTHAYILLSAVVERAGEQPFWDQVNERICKKIGLQTLQPDYQWIEIPNRAVGYRISRSTGQPQASSNTDVSWKLGGGGFISSIEDLAKFSDGLLGEELISEDSKSILWTAQKLNSGEATNIGLGFFVGEQDGQSVISHNGSQEKTRTRMVIYPETKNGFVVMSNSEYANCGQITTALQNAINK